MILNLKSTLYEPDVKDLHRLNVYRIKCVKCQNAFCIEYSHGFLLEDCFSSFLETHLMCMIQYGIG